LHRLATGKASLDASVIVDFYLAGTLALLEELFSGRLLMSDFVKQELTDADLKLTGVETTALSSNEEWEFFRNLRRDKPGLGLGKLGALAVARFHNAILVTNDEQARQAAEEFDVSVHGGIGVLEYAVEVGSFSGLIVVRRASGPARSLH
jgi:predicted nucleic acid-binding protein